MQLERSLILFGCDRIACPHRRRLRVRLCRFAGKAAHNPIDRDDAREVVDKRVAHGSAQQRRIDAQLLGRRRQRQTE
jgi:hypothetical protein